MEVYAHGNGVFITSGGEFYDFIDYDDFEDEAAAEEAIGELYGAYLSCDWKRRY